MNYFRIASLAATLGPAAAVPRLQIVAVPEPATYGALAAGAALLVVLASRRRS